MNKILSPKTLVPVGLVIALVYSCVFQVQQIQQAIVLQFGEPMKIVTKPGLSFKLPYQEVRTFENRIVDLDLEPEDIILSDQKRLVVDTLTRYKITDPLKYFQAVGSEFSAKQRLQTIVRSSLRSVLGSITLADLLSAKRDEIMNNVQKRVFEASSPFGVEVVDLRIRQADLPARNSEAIFESMKAERQREANEFRARGEEQALRIKAEAEKDKLILLANAHRKSNVLRGEGDAESIEIYAKAFNKDPKFYNFYRSLHAYKKSMSGENTTFILSPKSDFFRFFNKNSTD